MRKFGISDCGMAEAEFRNVNVESGKAGNGGEEEFRKGESGTQEIRNGRGGNLV
jgi:hypothetical protein